ncbi:hypothetical protein G6F42_015351 [Rhizopus arrhizus]|nr:hypothetical protein G6F42_015351 [Rhizopus arrhizus]
MYQKHFAQLENRPYHLFFAAKVVDVPMLMDIVGPVAEARQRLDLVDCTVLPSNVHVPQGFVNRATPTTIPEEQPLESFDDEEDIGFGPDDFEEVAGPSLRVFDVDLQSSQDVPPPQSTARTSVALRALQKQMKRRASPTQAQASTSSELSQQPSTSTSALEASAPVFGKRAGKQRAAPGVATTSTPQQPQQSRSSSTQQTQQSGSGTATTISSGSEPDYLGLYHMFEEPATEKPTFFE